MLFAKDFSNSTSSITERLKNNIARMEDSLKETGQEAGLFGAMEGQGPADQMYDDMEAMRQMGEYPQGYEMGGDYGNEGRYVTSMKRMIDEADRLVQEQRLPEQYFLQEHANILSAERVGPAETLQGNMEVFDITPNKIRDIEQHYLQETVQQTPKIKRGQRTLAERIEDAIHHFEELSQIKVSFEEILDRIISKDQRPAIETLIEQNEDMKELFDVIEGRTDDNFILNNLREMNHMYAEAIEVRRAEERLKTESAKNIIGESESHQKPSDRQFSAEVWTKLNLQGELTRRRQWRRELEGSGRET